MTNSRVAVESMLIELKLLCQQYQICNESTITMEQLFTQLGQHFQLLLKWNEKIALTRLTTPAVAARQLYFETLYAARFIDPKITSMADLGSGAGFPGLPLACLLPQLQVSLIEADHRKAAFLSETRRQLSLSNLFVINSRFEQLSAQFCLITARALESFSQQLKNIFKLGHSSQQLMLFISQSDAEQLINQPPVQLASAIPLFSSQIEMLPESQDRAILILTRLRKDENHQGYEVHEV